MDNKWKIVLKTFSILANIIVLIILFADVKNPELLNFAKGFLIFDTFVEFVILIKM